jgi:hypothetical protein
MPRCTPHSVYISQHITRTVSTTVYGIYVFWLQGMYTRESFASTWVQPRLFGGVGVVHPFSVSSVACFCFVCLRSVCCVPNVASFSGLPLRLSLPFIYYLQSFLCRMYPILIVSLDSLILIAPFGFL